MDCRLGPGNDDGVGWNLRKRLNEIYMKHTGQPIEKVEEAVERDTFFTAEAAKEFGLVDKVIERRPEGIDKG